MSKYEIAMQNRVNEIAVNLKLYKPNADGVENDSPIIQQALNDINSKGGGTLLIPKGLYNLKTALRVYKNTTIDMHPQAELIIDAVTPAYRIFMNGEHGNATYATGYNGDSNITIRGGILNCNGLNRAHISFAHARNIRIENVTMKNITDGHCIELCALKGVIITGCRFLNFKNVDTVDRNYVEAVQVDVCTSTAFPSFGSYDNTPNEDIVVEKCYFGKDDTAPVGFGYWSTGVGSHGSVMGQWNKNITVRDCIFDNLTYCGIRPVGWQDVELINNRFYACARGIRAEMKSGLEQDYKRITIAENSFFASGTAYDCIAVEGGNSATNTKARAIVIKNNYLENVPTGFNAIGIRDSDNVVITGNTVNGARRVVFMSGTSNVSITDNKGSNTFFQFTTAFECKNLIIAGNQCTGMGDAGVTIRSSQFGQIRNNLFIDCAVALGAIYLYESSGVHTTDFLIHDNVIGTGTANTMCQNGLYVATGSVNVRHYNNILKGSSAMANTVALGGVIITKADGSQTSVGVNASNVITFTPVT